MQKFKKLLAIACTATFLVGAIAPTSVVFAEGEPALTEKISVEESTYRFPSHLTELNFNTACPYTNNFVAPNLEELIIPSSVTKLAPYAFDYRYLVIPKLQVLRIEYGLKEVPEGSFRGPNDRDKDSFRNLYMADSVERIGKEAFLGNSGLLEAQLSNKLQVLEDKAFSYCLKLQSVSLGSNLKEIGNSAFSYCLELSSISLPKTLEKIGVSAFNSNIKLKAITIPASVETISESAFYYTGLETIKIEEGVKRIESKAFAQCKGRNASIYLPASINYIADDAFEGTYFKNIYVTSGTYAARYFEAKNPHSIEYMDLDLHEDQETVASVDSGFSPIQGIVETYESDFNFRPYVFGYGEIGETYTVEIWDEDTYLDYAYINKGQFADTLAIDAFCINMGGKKAYGGVTGINGEPVIMDEVLVNDKDQSYKGKISINRAHYYTRTNFSTGDSAKSSIDDEDVFIIIKTKFVPNGVEMTYDKMLDYQDVHIIQFRKEGAPTKTPVVEGTPVVEDTPVAEEVPAAKPITRVKTTPSNSTILVNGKKTAFDAYIIESNNYFKLRDVAYVLNGSEKQFGVTWDNDRRAIDLVSGAVYQTVGGEMENGYKSPKEGVLNASPIYKDGKDVILKAYTIGGNNYFKLRDLGQVFDFGVNWDGETQTVLIDSAIAYGEPAPKTRPSVDMVVKEDTSPSETEAVTSEDLMLEEADKPTEICNLPSVEVPAESTLYQLVTSTPTVHGFNLKPVISSNEAVYTGKISSQEDLTKMLHYMMASGHYQLNVEISDDIKGNLSLQEGYDLLYAYFEKSLDEVKTKSTGLNSFFDERIIRLSGTGDKWIAEVTLASTAMTDENLRLATEEIIKAADSVIEQFAERGDLSSSKSDEEIAELLYIWIVNYLEYDYDFNGISHNAYGAVLNQKAVCQGYTELYNLIASRCGLDLEYISGTSKITNQGHAWTKIRVGGQDLYIDTTWGDGKYTDGRSFINMEYFMVTEEVLRKDHQW